MSVSQMAAGAAPSPRAGGFAHAMRAAVTADRRAKRLAVILAVVLVLLAAAGGAYWFVATTPGWHVNERSGQSYLIIPGTRKRAKGVYEYEGTRYVFDDRGLLVHGWGKCSGHTYYADANGQLLTGVQSIDGADYYLDPDSGEFFSGFYDTGAGRIAYSETGWPLRGLSVYKDVPYYFNADGILQTGWFDRDDGAARYYALEDGTLQSGWQELDGATYHFDPKTYALHRGNARVDGKRYCFDAETGALLHDTLVRYVAGTCCADADGVCIVGWHDVDGSKYYFDKIGYALTGYQTLDGALYYFEPGSGKLLTGFNTVDGVLCYFGENGVIKPASVEYEGAEHLFDDQGRALQGWQTLAETTYYFVSGVKQTGEVQIEDVWYNLGADGILRQGWSGNSYYGSTGYALTGWQTLGNKLYYFDDNGILARNTTIGQYKIDANGVATKSAFAGSSAASCFNYVRRNMRYTAIGADSYENMLNYAMTYHRGACYHYATYLNYVLNQAGISNSIIWGLNPQGGTHVWNQLSNGYILDACNNYYMITPDQMRAMGFSW